MPGKVVRALSDKEIAGLSRAAQHYVDNWKGFKRGLKAVRP
jgi:carbonic anhydrase/acetyltransferase-like protein (isoleucine patch superfamily)